jgi:hypothetical protein
MLQKTVGIFQGVPQLDDLFGNGMIDLAAGQEIKADQGFSQQALFTAHLLVFLIYQGLTQVYFGNQTSLDKMFPQTGHQSFWGQWRCH